MSAVTTSIARRTADGVMRRLPVLDRRWDYKWGLVAKALVELTRASGDPVYVEYVRRSVDTFVRPDGSIDTYDPAQHSLDLINPGKVLFALLGATGDTRYRAALGRLRDQLRAQPRTPSGGFWHKSIYPDQIWLDGVYMASPFLAEYGATFGEPEVFDDVVRQFTLAYEHTRDERTGLLFHAVDESRMQRWADPVTGQSRTFWGRAVGWYLMALVDAVEFLPDAAQRATLLAILRETSEAVARVQDETGIWWQVLDQGGRAGNYLEQSCSSMFVYAFLKSARLGHLPAAYRDRAIQAQRGIVQRFVRESAGGVDVGGSCVGTGLGIGPDGGEYRDGSFAYYAARPVVTNDHHGVGAFLLAAVELERTT